MSISISTTNIFTDRPVRHSPTVLRGFFGRYQPDNVLLHQHLGNGKTAYLYPRVQYRINRGVPQITGINDGINAIEAAVSNLKILQLKNDSFDVNFVDTVVNELDFSDTTSSHEYRFGSPWLALSQKNYKTYVQSNQRDKFQLLKRILIGNLLSMAKSFDVIVTQHLRCEIALRPQSVFAKGQKMIGFVGRFSVNFEIPAKVGLGHLVSVGFGQICHNERASVK